MPSTYASALPTTTSSRPSSRQGPSDGPWRSTTTRTVRDELTTRIVEPHGLTADIGHWYLSAHCRLADGPRVFRLDRISRYELGDETYPEPAAPAAGPRGSSQTATTRRSNSCWMGTCTG
jgi:proteasome accessory factor C